MNTSWLQRACDDTSVRAVTDKQPGERNPREVPQEGTAHCAQNRARLVRALYTRLDRPTEPLLPIAT
ncbi:hypothetical protein [Streptomyces sp. NPDC090036]|uniref:hypothetical protein n=1 Tax=Streptomyces sp. NPDC090036 TaxID=3365926 RepID=UPI0037FAD647